MTELGLRDLLQVHENRFLGNGRPGWQVQQHCNYSQMKQERKKQQVEKQFFNISVGHQ